MQRGLGNAEAKVGFAYQEVVIAVDPLSLPPSLPSLPPPLPSLMHHQAKSRYATNPPLLITVVQIERGQKRKTRSAQGLHVTLSYHNRDMGQAQAKDAGGGGTARPACVPEPEGDVTLTEEQLLALLDDVRKGSIMRNEVEDRKERPLPRSLGSTQRYRDYGFIDEDQAAHRRAGRIGEERDVHALAQLVRHLEKSRPSYA